MVINIIGNNVLCTGDYYIIIIIFIFINQTSIKNIISFTADQYVYEHLRKTRIGAWRNSVTKMHSTDLQNKLYTII